MAENVKYKYKCSLCGRGSNSRQTCCGEETLPAASVHVETTAEPWMCPTCGAASDTPTTCCGKSAVRNPAFKG